MILTFSAAKRLAADLLEIYGMPDEHAITTAHAIVVAERWGVTSHGLMRLPYYLERLRHGGYSTTPLRTVADTGPLLILDGGGGLGHWQLWTAARQATERAGQYGVAIVAVGNSGHCGALGVYTLPGLESSMLTLLFSNGPAVMPPWGGAVPLLSTSPLAAGIPCSPQPAIVDMATTSVARGKIAEYAQRGETLPPGWAFDNQGQPTTDAHEALSGMLAPLGGAKGFALGFLVEALTGGLVGPALSPEVSDMFDAAVNEEPQRIAHFLIMIDPQRFDVVDGQGAEERLRRLAGLTERSGGRLPSAGRSLDIADNDLLKIAEGTAKRLRDLAADHGVQITSVR